MITMATAAKIWKAYNEIDKAQKLLKEMDDRKNWGHDPNPKDPFGQRRNLELGVRCSDGHKPLFDVRPDLAMCIIRAHIAEKELELREANEEARIEVDRPALTAQADTTNA